MAQILEEAFNPADIDKGGYIELPEGEILIDHSIKLKSLHMVGKGAGRTRLVASKDLDGPMFDISGFISTNPVTGAQTLQNAVNITIRDLSIDGNNHIGTGLRLRHVVDSRLDRVKILGWQGHGILAESMWDTVFTDVIVARCGTPDFHAIHLADIFQVLGTDGKPLMSGPVEVWATCNNNHFFGCRIENSPGVLTYLGKFATKNQFIGCKWHGQLNQASPSLSSPYDHILIEGYGNTISGCNLVRSGKTGIRLQDGAHGCVIIGNTIQNCDEYGIYISEKAKGYQVLGNSFWEGKNLKGNLVVGTTTIL